MSDEKTKPPYEVGLRDHFAGEAMNALLGSTDNWTPEIWDACIKKLVEMTYDIADAMIEERRKRQR